MLSNQIFYQLQFQTNTGALPPFALAYLWADIPTESPLGLPVYGAEPWNLPAPPFKTVIV